MTLDNVQASVKDIHVVHESGESWLIRQGGRVFFPSRYRVRAHAIAFASAVAYGANADMIVHDRNGVRTRLCRASLTYPTLID